MINRFAIALLAGLCFISAAKADKTDDHTEATVRLSPAEYQQLLNRAQSTEEVESGPDGESMVRVSKADYNKLIDNSETLQKLMDDLRKVNQGISSEDTVSVVDDRAKFGGLKNAMALGAKAIGIPPEPGDTGPMATIWHWMYSETEITEVKANVMDRAQRGRDIGPMVMVSKSDYDILVRRLYEPEQRSATSPPPIGVGILSSFLTVIFMCAFNVFMKRRGKA